MEIKLERTNEGYTIKIDDKRFGPFKSREEINIKKLKKEIIDGVFDGEVSLDIIGKIEEIIDKIPSRPLRKSIELKYIRKVYVGSDKVISPEGELLDVKTRYRVYMGAREFGEDPILIIDYDGFVNPKKFIYSLRVPAPEEIEDLEIPPKILKKLGANSLDDLLLSGRLFVPVPALKNVDFLRKTDWKEIIENIIHPGGVEIDPRLKLIRKATLLRGLKQKINPHSIVVLPGQTGKSEWYYSVGILEDRVSAVSLIGTATTDDVRPGTLDGAELPICIDQLEEQGSYLLFRYLLSFLELGEARVDMAASPFTIKGNSIVVITANPLGDPRSDFENLQRHLSKNPALGRRFGIILYDEKAVRIKMRAHDLKELIEDDLTLFRAVEEYCRPRLLNIIREPRVWSWLNTKNEVWINQALDIIEPLKDENEKLHRFLTEFIVNGNSHTRGGALYCALIDYMDKIALNEYDIEEILGRAEEYLSEILEINFESIRNIVQTLEERREDIILRVFDTLPNYLKEIVSAIELYKRFIRDIEDIKVPHAIALRKIEYVPGSSSYTYFSMVIKDALKGNPYKYNDKLREYFKFELSNDNGEILATIYDLTPTEAIKPLGNLGILGNLENFSLKKKVGNSKDSLDEDLNQGKNSPREVFQISQNSQNSKSLDNHLAKYFEALGNLVKCRLCGLKLGFSEDDMVGHLTYHREVEGDIP